jgi:hypothetical protein
MSRLIPLRIPAGWTVIANAFTEDARDEDLLLLRAGALHLDLGWTSQGTYRLELTEGDTLHARVESPSTDYMRDAIDLILGELARDADPSSLQRLLAV